MAKDIVADSARILKEEWARICEHGANGTLVDKIDSGDILDSIRAVINSPTKTYRYVLPTQVVAKIADRAIDCRCLQVARGGKGAFDARTIAHGVVVPFDQANENVLGGSPEPYVNNPLRVPEIGSKYRKAQKNQKDWDHLCGVLAAIEDRKKPSFTRRVFAQVLVEIYRRLSEVRVVYAVPLRVSLDAALNAAEHFLAHPSGGERLLALTASLFAVIGRRFGLFSEVHRAVTTAADAATGMVVDLECVSPTGEIVMAVEVKDRVLTIDQLKGKIPNIREKQVSEIFFVAQQETSAEEEINQLVTREFASGHNIYLTDFLPLGRVVLALIGEQGRKDFLKEVGRQLDEYHSDITHRRAWGELVRTI